MALALSASAASGQVCTNAPCLTFDEQSGNFTTNGFGSATAILSDYDGFPVGSGKREIAVVSGTGGWCQIVSGESGGSTPIVLATLTGGTSTSAVVSVGDLDGQPGDEIALSNPTIGRIQVWSLTQLTPGNFAPVLCYSINGPATLGTSMAMVDTLNGPRLAAGVPGQNTVLLFQLSATGGTLTQTLIPGGGRTGNFGASMAVGPGQGGLGATPPQSVLAVGAPTYNSQVNPISVAEGFVAVFNLQFQLPGFGQNEPNGFLYRGQAREQLGTAVASIGFLDDPGESPLSDFVALGRSQDPNVPSVLAAFHTPSNLLFTPTPQLGAPVQLISGTGLANADGRLASAGDVDGDGIGDVVLSLDSNIRMYSPGSGPLTPLASASYAGYSMATLSLSSGPDINQKGGVDVLVGVRRTGSVGGLVEAVPIAAIADLPNPEGPPIPLLEPINRPLPGLLRLQVTSPANCVAVLFATFGPPVPVPFQPPATLSYLNGAPVSLEALAISSAGTFQFNPLGIPNGFNFESIVYQVLQVGPGNGLFASNGLLARIGQF